MSDSGLAKATQRMREAGVPDLAIATFARLYGELEGGATGIIREEDIEPLREGFATAMGQSILMPMGVILVGAIIAVFFVRRPARTGSVAVAAEAAAE